RTRSTNKSRIPRAASLDPGDPDPGRVRRRRKALGGRAGGENGQKQQSCERSGSVHESPFLKGFRFRAPARVPGISWNPLRSFPEVQRESHKESDEEGSQHEGQGL